MKSFKTFNLSKKSIKTFILMKKKLYFGKFFKQFKKSGLKRLLSCQINNVFHLWRFSDCCKCSETTVGVFRVWFWTQVLLAEWNLQWSDDKTALLRLHILCSFVRQPKLNHSGELKMTIHGYIDFWDPALDCVISKLLL